MTRNLDAIYANGVFRPVVDVGNVLSDGERVRLTVESISQPTANNVLALAAKVYAGLSDEDISDVERIVTDRTHFFSQ